MIGDRAYRAMQVPARCLGPDLRPRPSPGRVYGTEACRLLVRHGFSALGLERISCGTFETNVGMQRVATDLGMTLEGRQRLAAWKDGRRPTSSNTACSGQTGVASAG